MNPNSEDSSIYDVIIVGAGIAGLSTAKYLYNSNIKNFVIIDSSDKIGGRIRTTTFGNNTFPTGPGWLHGAKGNPIYDIAKELSIKIEECQNDGESLFYAFDTISKCEVSDQYNKKRKLFYENLDELIENLRSSGSQVDESENMENFTSRHSGLFQDMSALEKTVKSTASEIYCGATWSDASAWAELNQVDKIYDEEEGIRNFRILDPMGIPKVIDHLARDLDHGPGGHFRLGNGVQSVIWASSDLEAMGKAASVILESGEELMARHAVVITVQTNLLLKGMPQLNPAPPVWKTDAWTNVPAVDYCRLLVRWRREDRFWPQKEWLVQVTDHPDQELTYWQNCCDQNIVDDLNPEVVLVCHLSGGLVQSKFMDMSVTELTEAVHNSMSSMFPDCVVPHQLETRLVSHWGLERWCGAFSSLAPGFGPQTVERLSAPLGSLYFAGESVDPALIGTMQGAYETGRIAAARIVATADEE